MSKELYISTRGKTNVVALTINGKLVEFNRENEDDFSIVGNIYKGKVEQVLKGMQAAFVNIGRKRNGYLYVGESSEKVGDDGDTVKSFGLSVKEGEDVMVQVGKVEIGTKGARLTANVSIPGRYLVYMPKAEYIGISRKITDEQRRAELLSLIESMPDKDGGYIVRTACLDAVDEDILEDAKRLKNRWKRTIENYENAQSGELVFKDGGLLYRMIRDVVDDTVTGITVDDDNTYNVIKEYLADLCIDSAKLIKYEGADNKDLFNHYGLAHSALKVLDSKVELESGGYLVIEETEALTVIDVNTGRFVGEESLEDTVFQTNVEAAKAVASQLRLRNLGGIIIVDFIDMQEEEHNKKLLEVLREYVARDRVRTNVVDMTPLGLVEITRKKSRLGMPSKMSKPCPTCGGKGYVMTNETLLDLVRSKLFDLFTDELTSAVEITLSRQNAREFIDQRALAFEISVYWQDKRIYVCPSDELSEEDVEISVHKEEVLTLPNEATLLY